MATIMDLLASILNPNPGQNRLVAPNANGPNYLTQTGLAPDQLARFHQMSGMGGQAAPATSMPQQMAPDQQQTAAVAPPAAEGGGILSRLFGGGQSSGENQTIQWLQQQGMDPGTATMFAKNKPALQDYLLKRSQGNKPIEIAGKLVDPNTYEVLADFSDKAGGEGQTRVLSEQEVQQLKLPPGSYQQDEHGKISSVGGVREQDPKFGRELDLRKEYEGNKIVQNYQAVRDNYERIMEGSKLGTGPGDQAIIYGYMKMLDPGSVVMEGERADAENAGGVPPRVRNLYNKIVEGAVLAPEARDQYIESADKIYKSSAKNLGDFNKRYGAIASSYELDPARILQQPEEYEPIVPLAGGTPEPLPGAPAAPLPSPAPAAPGAVAPGGVDLSNMPPPEGFSAMQWKFVPVEKRKLWLPQQ